MTPGSGDGEAAHEGGDGIHHLRHVRQNTPSSFAKMLAAELEYDNPELSEWAVVLYQILEQAWIGRQSEK